MAVLEKLFPLVITPRGDFEVKSRKGSRRSTMIPIFGANINPGGAVIDEEMFAFKDELSSNSR